MEKFNLYKFLLDKNKGVIDLCNYTLKVFDIKDTVKTKRSKLKLIKKYNKNLTPYWDNESSFRHHFFKKSNYYSNYGSLNPFKVSQQQDSMVVGLNVNGLDIECNNKKKDMKDPDIRYIFKNIGITEESLHYLVNFDEESKKEYEEIIIVNNLTNKVSVIPDGTYPFIPAMNAALGRSIYNNLKKFDMKYIESVLNDNNIELLKLLLGEKEYKDSLKNICEIEYLKNDSNMFEKFINHEKIFGILDLNNFVCVKNEE